MGKRILLAVFMVIGLCTTVIMAGEQGERIFDLGEIVITGTKTERIMEDLPVQMRVITREQIEKSGVQKAADLLRNLAGVHISGGAPGAVSSRSTVLLRGLPSQYSLILVDGDRYKSEHMHTGSNINLIPVDMIERIEIVEGPASSLYGSDAIGGVINIITRKGASELSSSASVSAGNNESLRESATFRFPIWNIRNMLNYTRSESNGEDAKWYERENWLWNLSVNPEPDQTLDIKLDYYKGDCYKGGGYDKKMNASAQYRWDWKDDSFLTLRHTEMQYHNYKPGNNDASATNIQYTKPIGSKNILTAGSEYRKEDYERNSTPRHFQAITGVFVQDELIANDKLSMAAAIRYEDYDDFDSEFTPKLSMMYDLSSTTKFRASVAEGYKAPSVIELYEHHYNHGYYVRDGNANLVPEESTSYSVGIERQVSKRMMWRLSYYHDDFENLITAFDTGMVYSQTDGNDYAVCPVGDTCVPIRQRQNVEDAYTRGITFEINSKPVERVTLGFGYSYLKSRDESTGEQLDYTPENSFNVSLGYEIGKFSYNLRGEAVSDRVFRDGDLTIQEMDNYFVLGGNVSYAINSDTRAYVTVENIFDESYDTFEEGRNSGTFGRYYYLGLDRKF